MGKNKSASNLVNVIDFNNDRIAFISGSTTLMSISSSGAVTVTGVISGSNAQSASYALNAGLLNNKDSAEFTSTGSFNAYTSSNDATVTSVAGTAVSAVAGVNALAARTSSYTTTSSFNSYTASNDATMSCVSSTATSAIAGVGALASKTGSYSTTGSNTFDGGAYFSSSFNPTGFSTTASLYTDGGLRVTKDAYISGTLYLNNVTVYGTQSVAYITSSQLNISTNLISVNTDTPSVRFGGLSVYDSGSTGLTGSILWDSENNRWIYSNPSGSGYSGGMFISGPRASSLGSETGTTSCMLLAGQGGDHLTSSMIYHDSATTCFHSNTTITSAGAACFASTISLGDDLTLASTNPQIKWNAGNLRFTSLGIGNVVATITQAGVACFSNTVCAPASIIRGTINEQLVLDFIAGAGSYTHQSFRLCGTNQYRLIGDTNGSFILRNDIVSSNVLTFACAGIATFACRICAPSLSITGDSLFCSAGSTTITLEGTTPIINLTRNNNASSPAAQLNFKTSQGTVRWQIASNAAIGTGLEINQGDSTSNRIYIDTNGIACFACQVCMPATAVISGGGNTLVLRKGTGTPALAFAGTSDEAAFLVEGISGGGMKWYTSPAGCTLSNAAWNAKFNMDVNGISTFSCTVCAPNFVTSGNSNLSKNSLRLRSPNDNNYLDINSYNTCNTINSNFGTADTPIIIGTYYGHQANQLFLATNCNVGIGTNAPSQKLHINRGGFLQTDGNSSWYRNVFERNVTSWDSVVGFSPQSSPQYTYGYINITASAYNNGTSAGGVTTSRWYYSITNNSISVSVVGSDIVTGSQAPSIRLIVSSGTIYVQVQSTNGVAAAYTTVFVDAMLASGYVNGTYWIIS